jgi:hypothetical protein
MIINSIPGDDSGVGVNVSGAVRGRVKCTGRAPLVCLIDGSATTRGLKT